MRPFYSRSSSNILTSIMPPHQSQQKKLYPALLLFSATVPSSLTNLIIFRRVMLGIYSVFSKLILYLNFVEKKTMSTKSPIAEYFRYKFLILGLFILGMFMAVFGPFYFPDAYYMICLAVLGAYAFKSVIMAAILVHNYLKFKK